MKTQMGHMLILGIRIFPLEVNGMQNHQINQHTENSFQNPMPINLGDTHMNTKPHE